MFHFMKSFKIFSLCLVLLCLSQMCFAKEVVTTAELLKSDFCHEFKCVQTSAFANEAGEKMVTYLLKKENAGVELLATVKGDSLQNLTLKSNSHDIEISPVVLTGYFASLLGSKPDENQVGKIFTSVQIKSRKDEFMKVEAVKLGPLSVRAASVLKYQTVFTSFQ